MTIPPIPITNHALHRMDERGITPEEARLAVWCGRPERMPYGRIRYKLGRVYAIIDGEGSILTAYLSNSVTRYRQKKRQMFRRESREMMRCSGGY